MTLRVCAKRRRPSTGDGHSASIVMHVLILRMGRVNDDLDE